MSWWDDDWKWPSGGYYPDERIAELESIAASQGLVCKKSLARNSDGMFHLLMPVELVLRVEVKLVNTTSKFYRFDQIGDEGWGWLLSKKNSHLTFECNGRTLFVTGTLKYLRKYRVMP